MRLTIGNIAEKYHYLPSIVLREADTFDLHIADLSNRYENYKQELRDGKVKPKELSQQEMLNMIKKVKTK